MGAAASFGNDESKMTQQKNLDHSSVATLRAVTEATQELITLGPTTWSDVESLLLKFGNIDIRIRDNFPGSRVVSDMAEKVSKVLNEKGYTEKNTLFASSVCPDEINHDDNNLCPLISKHMGECFQMGGLAGIPFSGSTGFSAFSHHVPDHGHLFILYAPHVGISPDGEFGYYARSGQERVTPGHACGAAIGAYNHICIGGEVFSYADLGQHPYDYQMQWIISKLNAVVGGIKSADNSMVQLGKEMFKIIDDFMSHIVCLDELSGTVVLLGGIQINTPNPMEDFFWPLKFEIRSRSRKDPINLLHLIRSDMDPVESQSLSTTGMLVRRLSHRADELTSSSPKVHQVSQIPSLRTTLEDANELVGDN